MYALDTIFDFAAAPSTVGGSPVDAIEEPRSGQRVVFWQLSSDRVAGELFVRPGGSVPVHVHGAQFERFECLSGTLSFRIGLRRRTLRRGEEIVVPAGTPHGFRNSGDEPAHLIIELTPPLRGEEGLRTLFGLQREGRLRITRFGIPRPLLQLAVLFDEYLDEIRLPVVPFRVQRVVFGVLARLGRRRGYRASFPEYGRPTGRDLGDVRAHADDTPQALAA
jgi:quercetin dioxygenase-like cupin family protein